MMNIHQQHVGRWLAAGIIAVVVAAMLARHYLAENDGDDAVISGNGRIEATEIDVATRIPGRIKEILVNDGDFVSAGQVLARIDADSMLAQLHQAEAQARQAQDAVATAQSQLAQRQAELAAARAVVAQREAELAAARTRARRSTSLAEKDYTSHQEADDDRTRVRSFEAAITAARAQVAAAQAGIAAAEAQIKGAQSAAEAATATVERIRVDIADNELKAPRDGRVQFRVMQAGEVVGAGGRVLNMVDLTEVYMTFFVPSAVAGRVALGSEVHLVLDAIPHYVIPARVTYVADVAQFTPKTVETASEREKLMFRVKAQLPPEFLRKHIAHVKTGVPGTAYVKLDSQAEWPVHLNVKLPQ